MPKLSIKQLQLGPMMNFTYLIADDEAKVCAVVDPGWDAAAIVNETKKSGWKIEKILLTHSHFDHAGALAELVKLTDAHVFVHSADLSDIKIPANPTEEGTKISIGNLNVDCIHTPGHTPGSQCFIVENAMFTGDTLFIDGCGRVDLPGSDPKKMISSLNRLAGLDSSIIIYPGHDYGHAPTATIGDQLKSNPYLRATEEEMLL